MMKLLKKSCDCIVGFSGFITAKCKALFKTFKAFSVKCKPCFKYLLQKLKSKRARSAALYTVGILYFALVVPIFLLNVLILVKSTTGEFPVSLFGVTPVVIETDDMAPIIKNGELAFFTEADPQNLKKGDVVCYITASYENTLLTVRRIVDITTDNSGRLSFYTASGNSLNTDPFLLNADDVLGVYKFGISGAGSFINFVQTPVGAFVFVVLPLGAFAVYDIIRVVKRKS